MSNAKHTPGPWRAEDMFRRLSAHGALIAPEGGNPICSLTGYYGADGTEANAALICAAPDLLAVLKEVGDWIAGWDPSFTQDDEWQPTAQRMRDAIAKAEGRSND